MKILIVSGFLGAGKTTFIQAMARETGKDFVVYENEYAGSGIDSKRLETSTELNVWESLENCVCCSGKADFATAVLTISGTLDPEYLVVEPTGVAKLSNILENIKSIQYDRITLLKPVVIVDATSFQKQRQKAPDIALDQIRSASTIVLSKTEKVLPEEVLNLKKILHKIHPEAVLKTAPYTTDTEQEKEWFSSLLEEEFSQDGTIPTEGEKEIMHENPMEKLSLKKISLPTPTHLIAFLNSLLFGSLGDILRAKGSLPCGKEWIRFDLAGDNWIITGEENPMEVGECAIIGEKIERREIRRMLQGELFQPKRKSMGKKRIKRT